LRGLLVTRQRKKEARENIKNAIKEYLKTVEALSKAKNNVM
jgi:predicted RNase H-like HicB family nuclease